MLMNRFVSYSYLSYGVVNNFFVFFRYCFGRVYDFMQINYRSTDRTQMGSRARSQKERRFSVRLKSPRVRPPVCREINY